MAEAETTLLEIRLAPHGLIGRILCPEKIRPGAGQYLLATGGADEPLPVVLFPASLPSETLDIAAPLPSGWQPGMSIHLRGPFGNGFQLPVGVRRLAVAVFEPSAERLYPLIEQALAQGAAVVCCASNVLADLPSAVEILPFESAEDVLAWTDYLAVDLGKTSIRSARHALHIENARRLPYPAQALVTVPMPCGGSGACGICSVSTRSGWKLACSDGPVFDLLGLEDEL